eukprot:m.116893 g.116893  ORF g.116893 m.116893 type:complete len:412 (+) comp16081_c3_seq1:173-1408(+)
MLNIQRVLRRGFATGLEKCKPGTEMCNKCSKFPCGPIMRTKGKAIPQKASSSVDKTWMWIAGAAAVGLVANVETVPVSGRLRLHLVPDSVDERMAAEYDESMLRGLAGRFLPHNDPRYERVQRVGERIRSSSDIMPLEYYVVDDNSERNAFVTASGKVVVYSGILEVLETDDKLAVILGHEIGHYIAHHTQERVLADWISSLMKFTFADNQATRFASMMMVRLPQSRAMETEADYIGLMLMARACFDLNAARDVWSAFLNKQAEEYFDSLAPPSPVSTTNPGALAVHLLDDSRPNESILDGYMSTHPSHAERLDRFYPGSEWMQRAKRLTRRACRDANTQSRNSHPSISNTSSNNSAQPPSEHHAKPHTPCARCKSTGHSGLQDLMRPVPWWEAVAQWVQHGRHTCEDAFF